MPANTPASQFDAEYYKRFYGSRRTRVHGAEEVARLATALTALFDWWKYDLESVLEIGAGVGLMRDWFARNRPAVAYRSTDVSPHACKAYGHERRDIARWRAKEKFDLVVCQGVLPYLDDPGAERAIANLRAMTGGFLYLEAVTRGDFREVCDTAITDPAQNFRPGAWYRKRLAPHFQQVGCGLWAPAGEWLPLYELERPRAARG